MRSGMGILGVGMYVPSEVRRNDWWSVGIVEKWIERRRATPRGAPAAPRSEGERLVLAAMAEQSTDPFQGSIERHIMPREVTVFDMEELAARNALEQASVAAPEIDLVLTHTVVPDLLLGNPACELHHRLGLRSECTTFQADSGTYSLFSQLAVAEAMIAAGRAHVALLVQSCGVSRLVDWENPVSVLFGDAATAIVVGRVSEGRGILGSVSFTDGRFPRTLGAGVPGGAWYDAGRSVLHVADPQQMNEVFLGTADACKQSIVAVLERTGHQANDVDFLCVHQGTPWLRRVVQEYTGLQRAKSVETFARTGYLFSAVVPAGLYYGTQQGVIADDDLVVLAGGGPGQTYGAVAMRWGT